MNAHLLHPDRDFDAGQPPRRHEPDLVQDLGLDTLCAAMGAGDEFLTGVARAGLLTGVSNDVAIVRYRQEVLRDCLAEPAAVRELYALAAEAIERSRRSYFGYLARSPGALLWGSVTLLEEFTGVLRRMRAVSERDGVRFSSRGFGALFAAMHAELDDAYLTEVEVHLKRLKFRHGMLVSAPLGARNEGAAYRLRLPSSDRPRWMQMIVGQADHGYSFRIDERDEAGARALGDLRDRAIDGVANAVSQAAEHVLGFFKSLRAELGFCVGAANLHARLGALGVPVCWPDPQPTSGHALRARGLRDACLALRSGSPVVANDLAADGKSLLVITGANQGGKSSFLRGLGTAFLMMEAGLFVPAEAYAARWRNAVFTHYKREEDTAMTMGKLDEELRRLSGIVDQLGPGALLLLNESFAATNEREGSEIARQVVQALVDCGVSVVFVTHLHEFAQSMTDEDPTDALLLRAERLADGTRTFRIRPGLPLATSYGPDLYAEIFKNASEER